MAKPIAAMIAATAPVWGTQQEAADFLNCTTRTIRNMIARGDIIARRFGPRMVRIDMTALATAGRPLGGVK